MTSKFEKDVQGVAVYFELRREGATCQILITPDGFGNTEGVVSSRFFRRVITEGVTKRRWKDYQFKTTPEYREHIQRGTNFESNETALVAENRIRAIADYLDSIVRMGYTLVNDKPIYVEVTKDDLSQINAGNLPAKLWTRVKSSRSALGFPEEATTK